MTAPARVLQFPRVDMDELPQAGRRHLSAIFQ
jgi:hypothetical protein